MEHRVNRVRTGFPELDEILCGGFPKPSSILLIGPVGTSKSTIAQQFLWNVLENRLKAVYVTVDTPPDDIVENMMNYGWDIRPYIDRGSLVFVDGFSPRVGLESIAAYIIENPFDLDEVLRTIMFVEQEFFGSDGGILLFSHISTIMFTWGKREIIKFMERMHAEARKFNSIYLFIYSEGVKPPYVETFVRQLPDVVIRVSKEWKGNSVVQYLWVEKCIKTNYRKERLVYRVTKQGITLTHGE